MLGHSSCLLHPSLPARPFKPASDSFSKTRVQESLGCFQENLGQLRERAVLLSRGELGLSIGVTGEKLVCFFQTL